MSHKRQRDFVKSVRWKYPSKFIGVNVFDVGSMDINGNNRGYFYFSNYVGIDIGDGLNVDIVGHATEVIPNHQISAYGVDTMISTEALEHDEIWQSTLVTMYTHLRRGGLMVITCAAPDRPEHGTHEHSPSCSPSTVGYYGNIGITEFASILEPYLFSTYFIREVGEKGKSEDLQFYGIKK
jgi:hypothetical protein